MDLVSLKIRAKNTTTGGIMEKTIFFAPSQLTMIKPNEEHVDVSMVKIGGEYFAVNGTPDAIANIVKKF
jgi:hypothetical protein